MEDLLDRAIIAATEAHSGTVRKGTNIPYILHPLEAAAIVATMTDNVEIIAAAVLHDTIEDTALTAEDIRREFGNRVAELVSEESENKREEKPACDTWQIWKKETIEHLRSTNDTAVKMIALGDKLSNIRSIYRDYTEIGDNLWSRFNQKDKTKHGWYYASIAQILSDLSEYPVWQEYNELVNKVFDEQTGR